LSQRKVDASIQIELRDGSNMYQVVSGSYATMQAATVQANTIAQASGYQPVLRGPYHLEADKFSTWKEAQEWENAFELSG
ncbi:hypothetical protein MXD81_26865, partial [Microbacteriaceae bacterium K1510]|nr:hypothetical protein [Microbacteriaceae bacterium K1510]